LNAKVIGRDAELALGGDLLDAIRSGAAGLVFEGPPGIGKSAIWEAAVDLAAARSYEVLSCRPAESETKLSYSAVADFLSGVAEEIFSEIPDPQRRALEVALLRAEPASVGLEHRAVSAGFLSIVTCLGRSGHVLLAIDDLQWLDRPSARVLEFAIRRLGPIRVGVLATVRNEDSSTAPAGLDRAFSESRFVRHGVGPLSLAALHQLLRERLGHAFPRPELVRIERASGGNPLFALEIARALLTSGPGRTLVDPLPAPESLHGLISARLARLPARCRELLVFASATSLPTVPLLERATGGRGRALVQLRAAVDAGVIEIEGDRIIFTHPLVAAVLYWGVRADERRVIHRRLAAVYVEAEARARHMALGADGPEAGVAEALEHAALGAKTQGAPDSTAELANLARRLTPPERLDDATRRGLVAADAFLAIGDVTRARAILEEDLERVRRGSSRAEILLRLSYFVPGDFQGAEKLLDEALVAAPDGTPLRVQILKELSIACFSLGDLPRATDYAKRAVREAEALEDPGLLAASLVVLADRLFFMGKGMNKDLIERALKLEDEGGEVHQDAYRSPTARAGRMLMYAGEVEAARPRLEVAYRRAVERGDEESRRSLCIHLSELECRAARFNVAMLYATEGCELAEEASHPRIGANLYARALVGTYLGRTGEARLDAERALATCEEIGDRPFTVFSLYALGFLALSVGDPAEADRHLGRAIELHTDMGFADYGVAPYLPDEIEALVALGDLDRAEQYLVRLEEQGRILDRPWALATAARSRGLLHAASASLDDALVAFEEALRHHERLAMPFELGRTQLSLGQVQRRRNERRAARQTLEGAVTIFDEIGAPLWGSRARAELTRLGLRRPGGLDLTPTEQRVAELAAEGFTNREVAHRLLISPKTVEANLARAYRKLGIRSRAELGTRMATPDR